MDNSESRCSVVVEVGSPPFEFNIDEALLVKHSGFFRGAMSGHFIESKTKRVPLHDDDPSLFQHLAAWLRTGNLDSCLKEDDDHEMTEQEDQATTHENTILSHTVDTLFNLWILGDKLQMPSLQNATAHSLIDLITKPHAFQTPCTLTQLPNNSTLSLVYDNTLPSSPLRRLAIDMALLTGAGHGLLADDSAAEELEPEILLALARRAVAFWHQETAAGWLAKRTHLRGAEGCYDVASLPPPQPGPTSSSTSTITTTAAMTMPGRLVLPSAEPIRSHPSHHFLAPNDIVACRHQRALGGFLPMRRPRLLTIEGGERESESGGKGDVYFSVECAQSLDAGEVVGCWQEARINLDELLDNDDGLFGWLSMPHADGRGDFSLTARGLQLVETEDGRGIVLVAELRTKDQRWQPASESLSERIVNRWGRLEYLPSDPSHRCKCDLWDVMLY
ncbi:putative btb poz domain containing protein [Lasiodiplodia theobromae]|nr:putative btb poz domain containing protein [Lasiodiplodia theobromae]